MTQEQVVKPIEIALPEFLELIPDAFVLLDANGCIRRINLQAERLLGYTQAELCGQLVEILVPERLRGAHAEHRRLFTRAAGSRPMGQSVLRVLRKDGSEVPVEISLSVVTTLAGECLISAALRDVRARQQAEAQIALQASLLAQIHDAVLAVDLERRLFYWNKGAEKLFGWTTEEAIGKTTDELFGAIRPGSSRALASAALLSTGPSEGELQLHRKDGASLCVDATSTAYFGPTGEHAGYVASFRDITRRKEIEAEVAAKREAISRLHSISAQLIGQQALPILLQAVVEAAVTIAHAARGMIHVYDAASQSLQLVGHLGCTQAMAEQFALVYRGPLCGEVAQQQRVLITDFAESGSLVEPPALDVLVRAGMRAGQSIPMMARDGRILGVVTILYAEPQRPSELEQQMLELLAREAGDLIDSRQREAALQRAVSARDQMLGVVAHDLRNPLNCILLRTQLLSSRIEPRNKESVDAITRDARRMNRLIQDLHDITHIESGALSMEPGPMAVEKAVEEAVETHKLAAAAARITLEFAIDRNVQEVLADRHRLNQVFDNLIGNAIKFTPPGGHITISAAAADGVVLFRVADAGRGIAAKHLRHVFNRFWQADSADRRTAGMGLAIVKGIVEAHGGSIWVESQLGAGSTFYFTLPAHPAHLARTAESSS